MTQVASRAYRVRGCLLGGAIGDAIGYTVEFKRWTDIERAFGPAGIREPVLVDGRSVVSDDTQMTLFTLEGMLRAQRVPREDALSYLQIAYQDWYKTQSTTVPSTISGSLGRHPSLRHRRAPGNTCLSAMSLGGGGRMRRPINNSKGCGGVMRAAPIGFFPDTYSAEQTFELAAEAAAITHGHPSGYLSAGVMAALIRFLVTGVEFPDAIRDVVLILRSHQDHEEVYACLMQAVELATSRTVPPRSAISTLGEGWVGEEALAIGVYSSLTAPCFIDAIAIAANHDGDSDSTASIAGQLWGAWRGIEAIPAEWAATLDVWEPIQELLQRYDAHPNSVS